MTESIVNKLKALKDKSDHEQYPMSCVVLYKGRALSGASNCNKTHPQVSRINPVKKMHCEIAAVLRIKPVDILKHCLVVIYRESKDGKMALARPCPTCMIFLKQKGVRKISYSTPVGFVEEKI